LLAGCGKTHVPVESVPELGYPECADSDSFVTVVARGRLRSGPYSSEVGVSEKFELSRSSCGYVFRSRQEWSLAASDIEVWYDSMLTPVWAWKRMTVPAGQLPDGHADVRRYELRTGPVYITHRDAQGILTHERLLEGGRSRAAPGAAVSAVIGPGRGVLTPWIERAHLAVREKTKALVLDFRALVETLEVVTLERNEDEYEPTLGRQVRVYTFGGKETVFADGEDVVIGDLAGMRPSAALSSPEPPSPPTYSEPDPRSPP
jgi:hypothetical protein